jgi:tellurite resistance protein TerC
LLITSVKLAFQSEADVHPEGNPVLRLLRRLMPMTDDYHGQHFFTRQAGRLMATPMLAVLVVVATTDVMFAIDSIPAAFSITRDTFLIIAANVCAVLGLRSLFFLLAHMLGRFAYLNYGLAAILAVAGVKFLISDFYHIPVQVSLGVIVVVLAVTIVASLRWPPRDEPHPEPERPAVHA